MLEKRGEQRGAGVEGVAFEDVCEHGGAQMAAGPELIVGQPGQGFLGEPGRDVERRPGGGGCG
ncbi:MAG: hypothetical protein ACRDPM_00700, partial [Solirubrobacteraceae bacterium]